MSSSDPKFGGQAFQKLLGSTIPNKLIPEFNNPELPAAAWEKYAAIRDKYNNPRKFTAFVGFKWTSMPGPEPAPSCDLFR